MIIMSNQETKSLNIALPVELHKLIKITAIQQGVTMSTYARNAIVEQLKREKKI